MIHRQQDWKTGVAQFTCDVCEASWYGDGDKLPRHPKDECRDELKALADLRRLQARHPGRRFAKSVMTGRWVMT